MYNSTDPVNTVTTATAPPCTTLTVTTTATGIFKPVLCWLNRTLVRFTLVPVCLGRCEHSNRAQVWIKTTAMRPFPLKGLSAVVSVHTGVHK